MEEEPEFPRTLQELRIRWAQESLQRSFRILTPDGKTPDYIRNNKGVVGRAANELCEECKQQLAALGRVAKHALSHYAAEDGHEAALQDFHSSLFTDRAGVASFLNEHASARYLRGLLVASVGDPEKFKTLLGFFVELGEGKKR